MSHTFTKHQVLETHIDVDGQLFSLVVGSWPDEVSGSPWAKQSVPFHIPAWLPEYGVMSELFLFSSPEWGGAGPEKPSDRHLWNPIDLEWHLPVAALQGVKDAQWAAIKSARAVAEAAGFVWDGSEFNSNVFSQQRINAKVILAMLDPGFSEPWVLADNSARVLSSAEMMAVGAALGAHVSAQVKKSTVLRARIEAATTADEVLAVCWSGQ